MTTKQQLLHHRPALAREQLGDPELYLAPEDGSGNRVLVYGWRLAATAPTHAQQLWMDRTSGALLYVDNPGARWPGVYHALNLDDLRELVRMAPATADALERFVKCAATAIAHWPYLAFEADWLEYELVTLADLYPEPTTHPNA